MLNALKIKNQKGFSLIEMMVVVVILGLIVLGLVTFFTGGAKSWVAGQSQLKAQREARQAIDRMVREIRHSELIINGVSKSITVNTPALGSNEAYIVTYSWIDYGDSINRQVNTTTPMPVIDNVQVLTFTYAFPDGSINILDVSKVHILLKVDVDKDGNPDVTLNTDVNLRNYNLPK